MITIQEWTAVADFATGAVMPLLLLTLFVAFRSIPSTVEM